MKIEIVLERLRRHEAELRAKGILSLAVFGSTARGEAALESDVDIAARIAPGHWRGLSGLVQLKRHLQEIVGNDVDVFELPVRRPRLAQQIDRDSIVAF